jgi:hypothetical protein
MCRLATLLAVATLFASAPPRSLALPLVGNPFATHPPGFVVHLPNIGPAPLPPGAVIGPIPFFDGMPNPLSPHAWEIELHNTGPGVTASNVTIAVPGGGIAFLGNIALAPGGSAYWDIHYLDVPEIGLYFFTASNAPGGVPGWLIDSSVIEYQFPLPAPAPLGGPMFFGAGGVAGPLVPGAPMILIDVVPEPSTLALASVAMVAGSCYAARVRRRKRARKT